MLRNELSDCRALLSGTQRQAAGSPVRVFYFALLAQLQQQLQPNTTSLYHHEKTKN